MINVHRTMERCTCTSYAHFKSNVREARRLGSGPTSEVKIRGQNAFNIFLSSELRSC
jgi:hypothetical protein